jgi:hypothetical protein
LNVITYGGVDNSLSTGSVSNVLAGHPTDNNGMSYDGTIDVARFYYPNRAQQIPGTDTLLVTEEVNIRLVDITTGYVSTVLKPIMVGGVPQNINGEGASASISYPGSVLMSAGSAFFYVGNNYGVRKVTYPSVVVSSLVVSGYTSALRLNQALSPDGSFIIMTLQAGGLIKKYNIASSTLSNIAGAGVGYTDCKDGVGSNAAVAFPRFPVISKNGLTLYFADAYNFANIRKMDLLTFNIITIMGNCPGVDTATREVINGMVLSPLETYLIVIIYRSNDKTSEMRRVDLETRSVTVITPSSGSNYKFDIVLSMNLVPGPSSCGSCMSGTYSLDGSICRKCPAGSYCILASLSPVLCPPGDYFILCVWFFFKLILVVIQVLIRQLKIKPPILLVKLAFSGIIALLDH